MDSILLPVLFSRTLGIRVLPVNPPIKGRLYLLSNSLSADCKPVVLSCLQTDANAQLPLFHVHTLCARPGPHDIIRGKATFQDVWVRNQWFKVDLRSIYGHFWAAAPLLTKAVFTLRLWFKSVRPSWFLPSERFHWMRLENVAKI